MYPFDEPTRRALFYALPAALVLLALAWPWAAARRSAARAHGAALGLACALAFLLWSNQNWQGRRYFNPYEFFHYYVGAKYARELGYTRLYDAAVLADVETRFPHRSRDIANLAAHRGGPEYKPLTAVLAEADAIRAPFTPERWAAFVHDVTVFRDELTRGMWEQLLHDKGYNATPAWTLVGGTLAELVPVSAGTAPVALILLDPLLLAAGFACVAWAFGPRAAGFAFALYFAHYCTSHAHFRAAFLRTDWLVALVASVCCLRNERPLAAGALLAWSALSRVFPLLFALGPVAVLADALVRRAPARAAALRFALGGVLVGGGVLALTLAHPDLGLDAWREFGAKIAEHDERPASDTIGFKKLFLWTIDFRQGQGPEMRALFAARAPLWWTIQALGAGALAWFVRRRPLWEAACLSFPLVWLLASPAYYYYAFLLVPLLFGAAAPERVPRAVALALVFATSLGARWFHGGPTFGGHFAFKVSWVMGLCAVGLLACAALERGRAAPAGTVP